MKPRAVGVSGRTDRFTDESTLDVDAVIWATGYRFDHSWIELPVADDDGKLLHRRGVTDVRGLDFLDFPGSARGDPRCSGGSKTTPSSSPTRSTPRRRPESLPMAAGTPTPPTL